MSTETFVLCDNPACSTAVAEDKAELREWVDVKVVVVIDNEGHVAHLDGHACSGACVGGAAQALWDGRDDD